jgi:phosphopantothenoylcysteine decarboxylase/phosphopantothenate--cysteine ligase
MKVFLGVSGGIAAYKAAALTSTLAQRGATIDVVMTAEAERFITPLTFASLTARPVYTSLWDLPERIPHIRLVREADVRGFLAEREVGVGRLAAEERIIEALERAVARRQTLRGKRVAITAGPTREAFDPVRFLSNASTGATGIALAREAALRGARVTLLLGPTLLEPPAGVDVVRITTAEELRDAALKHAVGADLTIATAAVADWRPAEHAESKLKKSGEDLTVRLAPNPDVLAALAQRRESGFLVGFAAETDEHEARARAKLRAKHLDAIAVNDVSGERGFGTGENALVLLWGEDGRRELGRTDKTTLAALLLDAVEELMECS